MSRRRRRRRRRRKRRRNRRRRSRRRKEPLDRGRKEGGRKRALSNSVGAADICMN